MLPDSSSVIPGNILTEWANDPFQNLMHDYVFSFHLLATQPITNDKTSIVFLTCHNSVSDVMGPFLDYRRTKTLQKKKREEEKNMSEKKKISEICQSESFSIFLK